MHGQHLVEDCLGAVERESQVADAAGLALLDKVVEHAVLDVTGPEGLDAAVADGVEQVVVDGIDLQILERLAIHGDGVLAGVVGEVRQLGGHEIFVARVTLEGDTGRLFRPALHVDGGGVEVVHAVGDGIVDQFVDRLLVYGAAGAVGRGNAGQPHHAVAEQRYPVVRLGVGAVGHLVGGDFGRGRVGCLLPVFTAGQYGGRSQSRAAYHFQKVSAIYIFVRFVFHCLLVFFEGLDDAVLFVAFDIDGTEGAGRAEVLAGTAADATLGVDDWNLG